MPSRGAGEPSADAGRNERFAAPDGGHRARRSVQSRPPDLVPVDARRSRSTFHARSMSARRIACLLGPTASGKTAAALAFAQRFPVEIVSVDSALVYRGMDIGTAKPTADERALAPHHLIDIIDPTESYSAAQFRTD